MVERITTIQYYGHDLFVVKTSSGLRILTDPYNEWVKPKLPAVEADVVLISHDHDDHNNLSIVKNYKKIIKRFGELKYEDVVFKGFKTFHDESGGAQRGLNTVFLFTADGITFAHMGDLGKIPDDAILNELKDVDVMFIPVGGEPTIDAGQAVKLISTLMPKVAIPMHFKLSEFAAIPFTYIDKFLDLVKEYREFRESVRISVETLPSSTQVWYIKPID
jgi:L-ascorbate metabolism protein UlaG (beta-lactamase superfamily)